MDMKAKSFTVFPSYCVGDNTPKLFTTDQLRGFLVGELDATHVPGDVATNPEASIEDLLLQGDNYDDFVRFDVTRPGCKQSTIVVYAGDQISK